MPDGSSGAQAFWRGVGKPIVKFCGGKTQLLPALRASLPDEITTYHEPFVGGGALFFDLAAEGKFKKAVIADANQRLIRMYRAIQLDVGSVIGRLWYLANDGDNDERFHFMSDPERPTSADQRREYEAYLKATYNRIRERDPEVMRDVEVEVWFLFLNRLGFNGVYRVNQKGQFNVPFGKWKKLPNIVREDELRAAARVMSPLSKVTIHHQDWCVSLAATKVGDTVLCDPPYVPLSATSNFTSYTKDKFNAQEQEKLAACAEDCALRGVRMRLTNSSSPWVKAIYERHGFTACPVRARRSVNSNGGKRGAIDELLFVHRDDMDHERVVERLAAIYSN